MKVLMVSAVAEKGGLEAVLLNTLKWLDRSRVTPVVALLDDGPLVGEIRETGTETYVIRAGRVRQLLKGRHAIGEVARLIRSLGIHLVHTHNSKAQIYGGLAAARANVPTLFHLHGVPARTFDRDGAISMLSLATPARLTIACSEYVAAEFRRSWQSRRDVRVIYNGVAPVSAGNGTARSVREEFGIPDRAPVIVMATRLQRWKGVHVLLDAVPLVTRMYADACFLVVGDALFGLEGEYRAELQKQVERLGLGGGVRFAGFQSDVYRFYSAADVVVHCSIDPEPFGMVLLEAMACARPVVASNCGGPSEIVEDGVSGLLVEPDKPELLGQAILSLLADPSRRARMGEAAVRRVEDKFGVRQMVEGLEKVYDELVTEKARR